MVTPSKLRRFEWNGFHAKNLHTQIASKSAKYKQAFDIRKELLQSRFALTSALHSKQFGYSSQFSFFYRIAIKSFLVASLKRFLSSFTHQCVRAHMFFHPLHPASLQLNCVSLFFSPASGLQSKRSRRAVKSRRLKGMIAHGKQGKVVFKKHSNLGGFQMLKHIHKDQLFSRADYWGNGYIIKVKQREQKQQPQQQQHSCILKLFFFNFTATPSHFC